MAIGASPGSMMESGEVPPGWDSARQVAMIMLLVEPIMIFFGGWDGLLATIMCCVTLFCQTPSASAIKRFMFIEFVGCLLALKYTYDGATHHMSGNGALLLHLPPLPLLLSYPAALGSALQLTYDYSAQASRGFRRGWTRSARTS